MARMTGIERREQLLTIAAQEFAARGLHGTSAEMIARRADISQPYVFRLFGTKVELFAAVVERAYERMIVSFEEAAEGLTGPAALQSMGNIYRELLTDRTLLLVMLHGFAACGQPEIQATVRKGFGALWATVERMSGMPPDQVKRFMALGMLVNDTAAMDLAGLTEPWAVACLAPLPMDNL